MTLQTVDPILRPPKIEVLARAYLLTPMSPIPVVTRVDNPGQLTDFGTAVLRVEAGGGTKPNRFQYDMTFLLHGYSPDEDEAKQIACDAIGVAAAARGQRINDGTTNWDVAGVMNVSVPERRTDPDVILPRYLAFVTWRIPGQPWTP
jgi:hypothetical protein